MTILSQAVVGLGSAGEQLFERREVVADAHLPAGHGSSGYFGRS